MKNQFISRQRKPFNEIIINNASELPTPTDTEDGLGLAHRLEDGKKYVFGSTIVLLYPIVLSNNTLESSWEIALVYAGTGALFRNNATTPIGIVQLSFIVVTSVNPGNSAFNITGGSTLSIDELFINSIDPGNVSNIENVYLRNCTFVNQTATFLQENISNISYFQGILLVNEAPIGDAYLTFKGNTTATEIQNVEAIPIGGDSLFNIDSATYTGRVKISFGEVKDIYGGIPFHASSLLKTNPRVEVFSFIPIPNSQTIGSMYIEHNSTATTITDQGMDGDITAFADAGSGQVTVTSAGHGLSNGEIVWIIDTDYTSKYTISNVTTNTFEITAVFTGTATGTWETNWVKVAGTTYPMQNERASMTDDNEITFANLEEQAVSIIATIGSQNSTIAAFKNWEFAVMKNDSRIKGGHVETELKNVISNAPIVATSTVVEGDVFEVYARNMSDSTTQLTVRGMSIKID